MTKTERLTELFREHGCKLTYTLYFFENKQGILRRAEKRGKKLPEHLKAALELVVTQTPVMGTGED